MIHLPGKNQVSKLTEEDESRLCGAWSVALSKAVERKGRYEKTARNISRYYRGPHTSVFLNSDFRPEIPITINKAYEFVRIFGPLLYAANPTRTASQDGPQADEALTICLQRLLNYTPAEYDLAHHSKKAVDSSLIRGRGVIYTGPHARTNHPFSEFKDDFDLFIDPTPSVWHQARWIMLRERKVSFEELRGAFGDAVCNRLWERRSGVAGAGEASLLTAVSSPDEPAVLDDATEKTSGQSEQGKCQVDLLVVFSKCGAGWTIQSGGEYVDVVGARQDDTERNVVLVFDQVSKTALYLGEWPIPFWAENSTRASWPFSLIDLGENSDSVWPVAPLAPALGEMEFLDWVYSFLLSKIRTTGRDILTAPSDLDKTLEAALRGDQDLIIVKVDNETPGQTGSPIQAIQMPPLNPAILECARQAEALFEKRTGLYEVLYGQTQSAYRSAAEANVKGQFSRLRVDDMSDSVESWQSDIARKEAIGWRWLSTPESTLPVLGQDLAAAWGPYVEGDLAAVMGEYGYHVVSGSMRRRSPQAVLEVQQAVLEKLGPIYSMIQDLGTLNVAVYDWLAALGVPNPSRYLIRSLPGPTAQTGPQTGPTEQQEPGPQTGPQSSQTAQPAQPPEVSEIRGGEPIYEGSGQ